jgi:hypothetical protein
MSVFCECFKQNLASPLRELSSPPRRPSCATYSLHVILNDLSSLLHNFFQFCHDDVFDVISDKSSLRSAIVTDESMQDRTPAIITGTKEENQIWVREELRIERDRTKVE